MHRENLTRLEESGVAGLQRECRSAEIIEIAYREAMEVLRGCSTAGGLKASAGAEGHREIWARDSMIALLGGSLVDDSTVRQSLEESFASLRRNQTELGAIPNHVDGANGRRSFRAYADGGLWFVIGSSILAPDLETIQRALH